MTAVALAMAAGAALWFSQAAAPDSTIAADRAALAAGFDSQDKQAIEAIVRDYILRNPEIVPEAIGKWQEKVKLQTINDVRAKIEAPMYGNAFSGNPNGDVVIVEFADFACGYCRASNADIAKLLAEDKNLKVVYRELPVLSEASTDAAGWALAAAKQGKYKAFHDAMFAAGRPSAATIEGAAKSAGLDFSSARTFANSAEVKAEIQSNMEIAQKLQFTGTPAWVIGNKSAVGAVGYDELKKMVAEARAR